MNNYGIVAGIVGLVISSIMIGAIFGDHIGYHRAVTEYGDKVKKLSDDTEEAIKENESLIRKLKRDTL